MDSGYCFLLAKYIPMCTVCHVADQNIKRSGQIEWAHNHNQVCKYYHRNIFVSGESLVYANGRLFSTFDRDNDSWAQNCAAKFRGGWWYTACHRSNLNGEYHSGGMSHMLMVLTGTHGKSITSRWKPQSWCSEGYLDSEKLGVKVGVNCAKSSNVIITTLFLYCESEVSKLMIMLFFFESHQ